MLAYNNFCGVLCRKLLTDNYASITKKHFLLSKGSSGIDPFSRGLYMTATSGFVKDIPVTVPRSRQVRKCSTVMLANKVQYVTVCKLLAKGLQCSGNLA